MRAFCVALSSNSKIISEGTPESAWRVWEVVSGPEGHVCGGLNRPAQVVSGHAEPLSAALDISNKLGSLDADGGAAALDLHVAPLDETRTTTGEAIPVAADSIRIACICTKVALAPGRRRSRSSSCSRARRAARQVDALITPASGMPSAIIAQGGVAAMLAKIIAYFSAQFTKVFGGAAPPVDPNDPNALVHALGAEFVKLGIEVVNGVPTIKAGA